MTSTLTLKDIAKEVGISYQAVSAVLNNRPGIRVSPQRREQILEIARKGGYQRNFSYDLFHRKKTVCPTAEGNGYTQLADLSSPI